MSLALVLLAVIVVVETLSYVRNPKRETAYLTRSFGSTPRDLTLGGIVFVSFFAGVALVMQTLATYPPLDNRVLWAAYACLLICFLRISSPFARYGWMTGRPLPALNFTRFGWVPSLIMVLLGALLAVNGYATPLETRSAQVVGKEISHQRYTGHRQYLLYVLAWPGSDRSTSIDSSESVYDRAQVGRTVQLTLGQGRLGLEWVNGVSVLPGVP